ncbi:MAG TPA: hypothetical protein VFN67_29490 [Polyangiales bacterium]|nr:hypothetical protein [Polyangiales bacterium]
MRVAGDESIVLRLRAELSSYRFRVVEQPAAARRSKELSELAEERDAQAALRAKPDAMAVELWIRAGGRTSEELVSAGPGRNPEVLALRVTEAMRARGLTLPPLVAAGLRAPDGAADSGRRGAPGTAADSSRATADLRKRTAADSSKRTAHASTGDSDPDDPGVAEPPPPPAATPIIPATKTGEPETEPVRANGESQKSKPPASETMPTDTTAERKATEEAERKAAEAAERKAAEAAERKAAEAAERKAAEAAARKAAEAAERKAAEAAERKAAEAAERKAAEAAERKAAEAAERKAAEAAERKAAEAAERKAAEATARKAAEAERKAAEAAARKAAEAKREDAEAADAADADATPEPEPAPEDTSPVVPRKALVYAEVGPSGVWSPGENRVGPTLDAMISLRFRPYRTSSISLVGLIPLVTTDLQTAEGATVEVHTYAIGGFGDLHLPLGRVELSAGLGALALLTAVTASTDSQSSRPYNPDYKTQRLAALLGRAGASYAITHDVRVSGSLMAGLTVNELRLKFPRAPGDGDEVNRHDVTWGKPLLIGNLSIELALPWDR